MDSRAGACTGTHSKESASVIVTPPIRVLVVDDTIVYRKIVSDILGTVPGVEVVGTASNGRIAMSRIDMLEPDLLILDIEMPEANGLQVLAYTNKNSPAVRAIMLSSFTQKGSEQTIKALELGAFDFIPKPESQSIDESREQVHSTLTRAVKAFGYRVHVRATPKGKSARTGFPPETASAQGSTVRNGQSAQVVAIGISTGGPNALAEMLPELPANLGVPVLIVQHMPPVFTKSLADSLNRKCQLEVAEATDGEAIRPNTVRIAPGGKQMKIDRGQNNRDKTIRITDAPPENGCKPSVDYLFRSIAHHYGAGATGVIMTGMGADGKLGAKLLKRAGAVTIAQDQATCVVYGMPKEVVEAGAADIVAPLSSIADQICRTVKK